MSTIRRPCRTERSSFAARLVSGVAFLASLPLASHPARAETSDFAYIPARRITPGIDAEEAVRLARSCNDEYGRPTCTPEDFGIDVGDGASVFVEAFRIERTEVTVARYERCVRQGVCRDHQMAEELPLAELGPDVPVTMVTEDDARRYCEFVHGRLPTEHEFESAARGASGRRYPWGNQFHRGRSNAGQAEPTLLDDSDGALLLAPALAYHDGRSPEGVLQLSGNVAEWTQSRDHDGRSSLGRWVAKGGHFAAPPWRQHGAAREVVPAGTRRITLGFRCVRELG